MSPAASGLAWVGCALGLLIVAPTGVGHYAGGPQDTHRYVGVHGDVLVGNPCYCRCDPGPPGCALLDSVTDGFGGAWFDFGTDLWSGASFRFRVDDDHGGPVGGTFRIVAADNTRLIDTIPYCGEYPAGGGFAPLPSGAFRIWIFAQEAGSVTSCLGHGMVGLPATMGTATVETS